MLEYQPENFISNFYFYLLILHLILILILCYLNFRNIKKEFKNINRKAWILLFFILLLGFCLRVAYVYTTYVRYGGPMECGWEYSVVAKYLAIDKLNHFCVYGNFENCQEFYISSHPIGYPTLLSFFFSVFGINNDVVTYLNISISTLTVFLVFLFAHLLFRNEKISLISSFLLSILPIHVYLSGKGEAETISVFFVTLTMLLFLVSLKVNKTILYSLAFLLLSYIPNIKPENLMFMVLAVLIIYTYKLEGYNKFKTKIFLFLMISPLLLCLYLLNLWYYLDAKPLFSLSYLSTGLSIYLQLLFNLKLHFIIPLFLFLAFLSYKNYKKQLLVLCSWCVLNFLVYGSFWQNNLIPRYIVQLYPALTILASLGIYELIEHLKRCNLFRKSGVFVYLSVSVLMLFSFYTPLEFMNPRSYIYPFDTGSNDTINLLRAMERVNKDAYIVTIAPKMIGFVSSRKVVGISKDVSFDRELVNRINEVLAENDTLHFFEIDNQLCASRYGKHFDIIKSNFDLLFLFREDSLDTYQITKKIGKIAKVRIDISQLKINESLNYLVDSPYSSERPISNITTENKTISVIQSMDTPDSCYAIEANISRSDNEISIHLKPVEKSICSDSCDNCKVILTADFSMYVTPGNYTVKIFQGNNITNEKTITVF